MKRYLKPLFVISILLIQYNVSVGQTTIEQEYQALTDLYQATNGASWTNNTGWRDASPNQVQSVQGWYGVTTDAQGHVIYLNLPNNNLTGSMPSSLGYLSKLQSLSLQGNLISGSIPASLGNLSELKLLVLNNNQLTGAIPTAIGNLINLDALSFANNHLSGPIPTSFGNLKNIINLELYSNQFTGSIPAELGNLLKLKYLYLQFNNLSGSIPLSLGSMISLENLSLYANQLNGEIPSTLGNLAGLHVLALNNNQLSGPIPTTIGSLINLDALSFANNQLSGPIPASFGNFKNIINLELYSNQFTGSIPTELGNLGKLKLLYLQYNSLSGSIPASLGSLVNLENLSLYANQLSGEIPSTLGTLTNLHVLTLNNNQLSGTIPESIGNLINLDALSFANNQLTGPIPSSFVNLVNVINLEVNANQLSGTIPAGFGSSPKLKLLYLQNNKLTGLVPAELSDVETLVVQANNLTFSNFLNVKLTFEGQSFIYNPQGLVDEEKTVQTPIGQSLTLTTTIDRNTTPASVYQWFKIVNGSPVALNDPSTNGHTVVVPNMTQEDVGTQYYYTITNSAASDLTLKSKNQTFQPLVCTAPTLDFQSERLNGTYTFNPSFTGGDNCTVAYSWDFGDGATSSETAPAHAYGSAGTYTATVTVSYTCGSCPAGTVTQTHSIQVQGVPGGGGSTGGGPGGTVCSSIYCDGDGNVGIGTQKTEGFRLSVNGKIRAGDIIKVYPESQWSDFVFEKNYRLRPLKEVERYIQQNGHLPEIPSAKEVAKEGVDLGAMDAKLLQKVEELTLYIIQMNENMTKMNEKISQLERENQKLKAQHKNP